MTNVDPTPDSDIVEAMWMQALDADRLTVHSDGAHVIDAGDRNLWIFTESADDGTVHYAAQEGDPSVIGRSGILWEPESDGGPWALMATIAEHIEDVESER